MTIDMRAVARTGLINLALAAGVFLPIYLGASGVEIRLRFGPFDGPIAYHSSGAFVQYLGMIVPVLLGSLVHTTALVLILPSVRPRRRRLAAVLLASLLPLSVILLGLSGALLLVAFGTSTVVATIAYGLACRTNVG